MLVVDREKKIVSLVISHGSVSVRGLAEACGVTEMTIRRDLQRLEAQNLLERTHGGAISKQPHPYPPVVKQDLETAKTDALILAPTQNRAAHALKEKALRNKIPLLAESSSQDQGIYLGPDNAKAAKELGQWTGKLVKKHATPVILDVSHLELANTRGRSRGFIEGFRHVYGNNVKVISVDARGLYNEAYQLATDALKLHPEINIIFGVNDDSILGALQAYTDLGRDLEQLVAVNVGGEGKTLLDVLQRGGPLKACAALFPELVGQHAIDGVVRIWSGEKVNTIETPSALLTSENLHDYYAQTREGWQLKKETLSKPSPTTLRKAKGKHISFVIQYRTHEWYQTLAKAMQRRAEQYGITFEAMDVQDNFRVEIMELRRLIGKLAASYVSDGETILLDAGTTTRSMAQFLHDKKNLTVITNSLEVFRELQPDANISLKLTGGDFHAASQSLVGRGAHLFLQDIRADKVFLVAGGVSTSFGVSSLNVEEAEVRRSMIASAREVIILADHTVLDHDANVRVTGLENVDTLITDAGVLASQSLALSQQGIRVVAAGKMMPQEAERRIVETV
jgi:DeoR/GlpR family transcriptional regulator of sugar metabolism